MHKRKKSRNTAKLRKYLLSNGIKMAHIAQRLDLTRAAVSYWANGKRIPRVEYRKQLQKLTKGLIKARDWE